MELSDEREILPLLSAYMLWQRLHTALTRQTMRCIFAQLPFFVNCGKP